MQPLLMRHICSILTAAVLAAAATSCGSRNGEAGFGMEACGWPSDASEGYSRGVSAPFCGFADGRFVTAGGANFPEVPAAKGGAKRYYSDIYVLDGKNWMKAGELPEPLAYGGSFSVNGEMLTAGGNNGKETVADVFRIVPLGGGLMALPSTPLPFPVEQAGYACDGNLIYIAGGLTPDGVSGKVISGKVSDLGIEWTEIADMPEPLVQPIAFVAGDALYVWGGFDPDAKSVSSKGWRLSLGSREWEYAGEGPSGETFAGAAAAVLADGRAVAVGGVDKDVFTHGLSAAGEEKAAYMTMDPEDYRFNRKLRIFDPEEGRWTSAGEDGALALAGAGIASDGKTTYITGGEIKPGIRTTGTWKIEIPVK